MLALSQSKFQEAGDSGSAGLWRVPTAIALNYKAPEESDAALRDPARSAEIAALYLKSLIDIFGPDDFMYAIACFGMPTSQAGDLKNLLDEKADADARRDFWRMARAGVVPPEGADRVVRFFAAGVVAENPQAFGVGGQPLSWLISN